MAPFYLRENFLRKNAPKIAIDIVYSRKGGETKMRQLSNDELAAIVTGELTLAAVLTVLAISLMAVVIYKLFMSKEGSSTVPGGWKFTWK